MEAVLLPALSPEDNLELLHRAKDGDAYAKEDFFARNQRLVHYTAAKFEKTRLPEEDRISAAQYGFLKAYNTFDFSKEVKFATYATRCMENEILMYFRKVQKEYGKLVSLDTIVVDGEGFEKDLTLGHILPASDINDYAEQADNEFAAQIWRELEKQLAPKYIEIVKMDIMDDIKQDDIAAKFGFSQTYISRVVSKAKKKMRCIAKLLEAKDIYTFTEAKTEKIKIEEEHDLMGNKEVNYGALKWFFENTTLYNAEIARITGYSIPTIVRYLKKHELGKLNVAADPEAVTMYETYMLNLNNEQRKQLQRRIDKARTAPSKVTSYKIDTPITVNNTLDKALESAEETLTDVVAAEANETTSEAHASAQSETEAAQIQTVAARPQSKSIAITLDSTSPEMIQRMINVFLAELQPNKQYNFWIRAVEAN